MEVGKRIKERREFLDLSLEEVAKKIGKNKSTICRYESKEIENMPLSVLEPIALALRTTPEYLMGWVDNPEPSPAVMPPVPPLPTLESKIEELNDAGRDAAEGYVDYLLTQPKYRK